MVELFRPEHAGECLALDACGFGGDALLEDFVERVGFGEAAGDDVIEIIEAGMGGVCGAQADADCGGAVGGDFEDAVEGGLAAFVVPDGGFVVVQDCVVDAVLEGAGAFHVEQAADVCFVFAEEGCAFAVCIEPHVRHAGFVGMEAAVGLEGDAGAFDVG